MEKVLCGRCKVAPQTVGENESYRCAMCGRTDSFAVIQNEVAEYAADYLIRKFETDVSREGDPLTNSAPEREYRWIFAENF